VFRPTNTLWIVLAEVNATEPQIAETIDGYDSLFMSVVA
jgi:hypothetical protein